MKICKNCQKKIPEDIRLCPYCQTSQENWLTQHKLLTVLLIWWIFSAILVAAFYVQTPKTSTQENKQISESPSPTPIQVLELNALIKTDSTHIYITNNEKNEWDACDVAIPHFSLDKDAYVSSGFVVKPGQTVSVAWLDLAKDNGERFNYYETKPATVELICSLNTPTGQEAHVIFSP